MTTDTLHDVPIEEIFCDDLFNCRGGAISTVSIIELAKDIETHGLIQPIVIQPYNFHPKCKYRIVVGHRRYTACKFLGYKTIKAIINDKLTEISALTMNFSENLKRKDLNPIQEAKHLRKFKDRGLTLDEIGKLFDFTGPWVHQRLQLLELPEDIQNEVAAGMITLNQALSLLRYVHVDDMYQQFREMKDAKARGEKFKTPKVPMKQSSLTRVGKNPINRKIRSLHEMNQMQDLLMDAIGPGLPTRLVAWAAGRISDIEFLQDVKNYCEENGIVWFIPHDILLRAQRMEEAKVNP